MAMSESSTDRTCIQGATLAGLFWLLLLAFGGGLLSMYYAKVGYFPELAWEDSLTYLGMLSILGGVVVVAYCLLLFIPGVIWSKFLISDRDLRCVFCYYDSVTETYEPCFRRIIRWIVAPFLVIVALSHLSVIFARWHKLLPACISLILLVPLSAIVAWKIFGRELKKKKDVHEKDSVLIKSVLFFGVSIFINLFSLFIIYGIAKVPANPLSLMLGVCTVVVTVSNLFVGAIYQKSSKAAVAISLVAAITLLSAGEFLDGKSRHTALSSRLMALYGFNDESQYSLILDKKGSRLAARQGFEVDGGTIHQVRILSRLGSEYVLCTEGRRFSIPKSTVLSWSDNKSQADPEPCPSLPRSQD